MKAILLSIGDELLIGQVVNTNASWLGEKLTSVGISVVRVVALGDNADAIASAVSEARESVDLVIVTGGLGPTHDDITKAAVANVFDAPMRFDEAVLEQVRDRFSRRGREMPESNRSQAMIPEGFEALPNPVGTAPGLWKEDEHGVLVVTAGVPHEMKTIVEESVLPRLRSREGLPVIAQRTVLTTGMGESNLQELIGPASAFLPSGTSMAYLPSIHGVRIRVTARHSLESAAEQLLDQVEQYLLQHIGKYVFGTGRETLEHVVGEQLRELGATVGTAESCSGGLIAHRLTNVPGSSAYMRGGIVAYENAVKRDLLGVPAQMIESDGAVSEPVVRAMAEGATARLDADYCIATSGIMGPGGGTDKKPIGTVWMAVAGPRATHAIRTRFPDERERNKARTATAALAMLLRVLKRDRL